MKVYCPSSSLYDEQLRLKDIEVRSGTLLEFIVPQFCETKNWNNEWR